MFLMAIGSNTDSIGNKPNSLSLTNPAILDGFVITEGSGNNNGGVCSTLAVS